MPADIAAEAARKPKVEGDVAVIIAGRLIQQHERKRAALKRSISLYESCRKT